jgi:endo-1,4-beta-xylanase
MSNIFRRLLPFLLMTLLLYVGQAPFAPSPALDNTTVPAYLTLDTTPTSAPVNSVVTLHVIYFGIGLYETSITVTPNEAISFDPPRSMPCRYNQDPTNCTQLTFRTRTPGLVTIHASAYGEIYDSDCSCWRFTGAGDDAPAVLTITGSRILLPLVHR